MNGQPKKKLNGYALKLRKEKQAARAVAKEMRIMDAISKRFRREAQDTSRMIELEDAKRSGATPEELAEMDASIRKAIEQGTYDQGETNF